MKEADTHVWEAGPPRAIWGAPGAITEGFRWRQAERVPVPRGS